MHKPLLNENFVGVYEIASVVPLDLVAYSHLDLGSM